MNFATIFVLYIIHSHSSPVAVGYYSTMAKCEAKHAELANRRPEKEGFEIFCVQRVVE